jgi:Zn-dependent protease with chaperone function
MQKGPLWEVLIMNSTNWLLWKVLLVSVSVFSYLSPAGPCLAQAAGPTFPDPGHPGMSRQQQIQLGMQSAAQVYKQMPVLPDSSPETQYVRQLGKRLVATIPPEHTWPYEFHVVAQKEINAFALPGGEMFINIGTITAAANEAQLAGVMGHEMSHVYMQHSAKQERKDEWTQGIAGLAGAVLGARGGLVGELAQEGAQMGASMLVLKYSRTDEAQADHVGAIILYRAGYNPQALADFFKTLEAQGGTPPQLLSDHPNPGNRELAIQKEIAPWPPKQYAGDSPEFAKVRQHASGVKAYTAQEIAQGAKSGQWAPMNKRNGAVFAPTGFAAASTPEARTAVAPAVSRVSLNDVMANSNFQLVDLGVMKIARPENWEVIAPKKQGQSLTIAPREGIAGNGVGYGVVINAVSIKNQQATIDQVTDAIVRSIEGASGETRSVGAAADLQVAGVRGRTVHMESTSEFSDANGQAQKERDQLVTIPRQDGTVVYLVFVAPESDFQRFNPTFEKMLQSIQ